MLTGGHAYFCGRDAGPTIGVLLLVVGEGAERKTFSEQLREGAS